MISRRMMLWFVTPLALLASAVAAQETSGASPGTGEVPRELVIPAVIAAPFTGDLPEIRDRGTLRALVSFSRTDFFLQGVRPRGIMVELLDLYEKRLNKGLKSSDRRISIKYVPVYGELMFRPRLEADRDPDSGPAIESCPVARPLRSAPRRLRKV